MKIKIGYMRLKVKFNLTKFLLFFTNVQPHLLFMLITIMNAITSIKRNVTQLLGHFYVIIYSRTVFQIWLKSVVSTSLDLTQIINGVLILMNVLILQSPNVAL